MLADYMKTEVSMRRSKLQMSSLPLLSTRKYRCGSFHENAGALPINFADRAIRNFNVILALRGGNSTYKSDTGASHLFDSVASTPNGFTDFQNRSSNLDIQSTTPQQSTANVGVDKGASSTVTLSTSNHSRGQSPAASVTPDTFKEPEYPPAFRHPADTKPAPVTRKVHAFVRIPWSLIRATQTDSLYVLKPRP
jgi:hypothetical protein